MTKHQMLALKVDAVLAFVDLKVGLLLWVLIDLYRNTMLLSDIAVKKKVLARDLFQYIWQENGSPYLIWIPVVIVGDIFIKRAVRSMLE